jgi:hypothetical protein
LHAWQLKDYFVIWPRANDRLHRWATVYNWMSEGWTNKFALMVIWVVGGWVTYVASTHEYSTAAALLFLLLFCGVVGMHAGIPLEMERAPEGSALALPAGHEIAHFAEEWRRFALTLPAGECETELWLRWNGLQGVLATIYGAAAYHDMAELVAANTTVTQLIADTRKRWRSERV